MAEKMRFTAKASGTRTEYAAYDDLPPSAKEYIHAALRFLDLESTPERRRRVGMLLQSGAWEPMLDKMRYVIDGPGKRLRG